MTKPRKVCWVLGKLPFAAKNQANSIGYHRILCFATDSPQRIAGNIRRPSDGPAENYPLPCSSEFRLGFAMRGLRDHPTRHDGHYHPASG